MKTGKEFAVVFVSDYEVKTPENNAFKWEASCLIDELYSYLNEKENGKPFSIVFEERFSERVNLILREVYCDPKAKETSLFFVVPVPNGDYNILKNGEEWLSFMEGKEEFNAALWIASYCIVDYKKTINEGYSQEWAFRDLKNDLIRIFKSPLMSYSPEIKEKVFEDFRFKGFSVKEVVALRKSIEKEGEEEQEQNKMLKATPLVIDLANFITNGEWSSVPYNLKQLEKICNGEKGVDEKLFLQPQNFGDYKHRMRQRKGIETGLNLQIEGSADILPFELVGGITLICGARKHGKTTFLLNMLFNEAKYNFDYKTGKKVLFFSYEETWQQIVEQLFALYAREPMKEISACFNLKKEISKLHKENDEQNNSVYRKALEELEREFVKKYISSGLITVVGENLPVEELVEYIKAFCKKNDCSLIGLDYIQEIYSGLANMNNKNRVEQVKYIGEMLRNTVNNLHVPFLAAAQFNRNIKTPLDVETNNISEAGDLERNAQAVIGLFNIKELKDPGNDQDRNAVASLLYGLGMEASDFIENVPNVTAKESGDKRQLKSCLGKIYCRLICSRFTEAPANVILNMDGKSGFIDIKSSYNNISSVLNNRLRLSLKQQILNLPESGEISQTTKTIKPQPTKEEKTTAEAEQGLEKAINAKKQ